MQVKVRQYPHPVLSLFSDDLVECGFQTSFKNSAIKNSYIIDVTCITSNKELAKLILEKKACYAFHFECPATRFRKVFKIHEEKHSFQINADLLKGRVQVCAFIVAMQDILNYSNSNFNQEYGNITFKVSKGDVLAVAEERDIFAHKDIDPLRKIPSIFRVCRNNRKNAPSIDIDLTNDYIIINLNPILHERYIELRGSPEMHTTLASLTVFPALVSILESIKSDGSIGLDEYADKRWFSVLSSKLAESNIDVYNPDTFIDSSISLAQNLIGNPLIDSLKTLLDINSGDADEVV